MKNQRFFLISFALTCLIVKSEAFAQTSQVEWSSFNQGFGAASSANTQLCTAIGQSFVGTTQNTNTQVVSGFLVHPFISGVKTAVEERKYDENQLPTSFELEQNYPNPFNPTTKIQFALPHRSSVRLTVYDMLGQKVVTLVDAIRSEGKHAIEWNGLNEEGTKASSGIYFYRLEAKSLDGKTSYINLKDMLLLK